MSKLSNLTGIVFRKAYLWTLVVCVLLCVHHETQSELRPGLKRVPILAHAQHQRFVDASSIKPSLILITPQSFKVPTRPSLSQHDHNQDGNNSQQGKNTNNSSLQQFVAVINNAHDAQENDKIRQNYKQLSLQVRDASSPITGQLFYEHIFDYFPQDGPNHLLIPINLEQVSFPANYAGGTSANNNRKSFAEVSKRQPKHGAYYLKNAADGSSAKIDDFGFTQQAATTRELIVSIRPHRPDSELAGNSIELTTSTPVLVEDVPSADGRRSFSIVQTDKPIYKPNEKVRIRIMVVNENLRPLIDEELKLQIKNPHGIIVEEIRYPRPTNELHSSRPDATKDLDSMFIDHTFEFPTEPMQGIWSVHIVHSDPVANESTNFEVKEYVLPPFEVTFESPDHILPTTSHISGAVIAKYHYGKPVQGKLQLKFGYILSSRMQTKFVARSVIKDINPTTGRVEYNISLDKFRDAEWFPAINGARLVVKATINEMQTGHRETAEDTACLFLQMPYKISFEQSIEDFQSGLSQTLKVRLVQLFSLNPGPSGVKILATYQDQNGTYLNDPTTNVTNGLKLDSEAITDSAGWAKFNIGPLSEGITSLTVTMKLLNPNTSSNPIELYRSHGFTGKELAINHHTLVRHESQNGWIALMNKTITHRNVGDLFVSDLLIRDAMVLPHKIFYMVVARGQIVELDTLNKDGLVSFRITEDMMPSIRLVLFALTHDSIGFLSDSMRIEIGQNLNCNLKLQYQSYGTQNVTDNSVKPNDRGRINISAREGDLVSLIGVDNAIYSLNNRTRLEAMRTVERIKRLDTGCGFGGGKDNLDVFHNAGLMFHNDASNTGINESDTSRIGSLCLTIANQMRYTEEAAMGYTRPVLSLLSKALGLAHRLRSSVSNQRQQSSRTKREIDPESILKRYKSPIQRSCCRLGTLEDIPQRRNCTTRKRIVDKYMQHANDCSTIYYECCRAVFGEPDVKLSGIFPARFLEPRIESRVVSSLKSSYHQQTQDVTNYGNLERIEAETLVRKDFKETWLFDIVKVTDPNGSAFLDVNLPHSISSWSISAVALNRYQPMCIMPEPFKMRTFQDVFIRLTLPYKVIQGEQIDMVVTLFNYSPQDQTVVVYMYGTQDVCSEAEPGERSNLTSVSVNRHSSQSVIFSIIPLKVGHYPIKVVAATSSSNNSDIIEQQLNVVPRGRPVTDEITFSLDPLNYQRRNKRAIQTGNLLDDIDPIRGLQHSQVRLTPSRESDYIVPQTQECIVSAIGDKVGQAVQTTILDVESLIRMPHGCGEQVMIYLGPTLYTAKYLHSINRLTGDMRWRAIRYIQSGYKSVLNFRKENGAFSSFAKRDASVWLTAYVTKMLCQTERTPFIADEVYVDKTVVNSALNWLIDQQNSDSGTWIERNPVYHREMLGGVLREKALTAFVTITFNECAHHSQDLVEELQDGTTVRVSASTHPDHEQTNGVDRLKVATQKAEKSLTVDRYRALREKNPYVLALIAYSQSFSQPKDAISTLSDLMSLSDKIQTKNQISWRGEHPIETAAYALQTLIELAPLVSPQVNIPRDAAVSISNYLSSRRSFSGSFESTQDTVVALEALTKFAKLQSSPNGSALIPKTLDSSPNLMCNVTFSNRTRRSIEFDRNNAQILQTFKLQSFDLDPINGEILDFTTSGNGLGTMSVKLKYNVYQDDNEICRFDIDSSIEEWLPPKVPIPDNLNSDTKVIDPDHTEQGGSASENEFFRTFDKNMLGELNVIGSNDAAHHDFVPKLQVSRDKPTYKDHPILRTKRYAAVPVLDLSAKNKTNSNESWTSKVVSSIKSKLPSWIAPKTLTTTTKPADLESSDPTEAPRRNTTSRRSTPSPAPLIITPDGIPLGAHLNSLSSNFSQNPARSLVLLLRVCTHHMSSSRDSEMAVIEVGILSGFKPNEADLKEILNDIGTPAMKYELSADRSMVVLYMKYIPFSGPYCFQFRLVRDSLVYNLQSGYIAVYEYYSPTRSCSNFYSSSRVNNLIETKCDDSGQVCQCVARSLCPATKKLMNIGEIASVNATSAREHLVDLVCSNRYDIVSFVRLKNVRYIETSQMFKLSLSVKSDLKGNLTKIVADAQRQQRAHLLDNVRKPNKLGTDEMGSAGELSLSSESDDGSSLHLSIESTCVKADPLLLHLAHPKQWKQGGELMILFARKDRIEKRYFKTMPKSAANNSKNSLNSEQYSLAIQLDRETILHDVTYQTKSGQHEAINNPLIWLDLKSRRDNWSCPV